MNLLLASMHTSFSYELVLIMYVLLASTTVVFCLNLAIVRNFPSRARKLR